MKIIRDSVVTVLVMSCMALVVVATIQHRRINELTEKVEINKQSTATDAAMTITIAKDYLEFKKWILINEKSKRNKFDI